MNKKPPDFWSVKDLNMGRVIHRESKTYNIPGPPDRGDSWIPLNL